MCLITSERFYVIIPEESHAPSHHTFMATSLQSMARVHNSYSNSSHKLTYLGLRLWERPAPHSTYRADIFSVPPPACRRPHVWARAHWRDAPDRCFYRCKWYLWHHALFRNTSGVSRENALWRCKCIAKDCRSAARDSRQYYHPARCQVHRRVAVRRKESIIFNY